MLAEPISTVTALTRLREALGRMDTNPCYTNSMEAAARLIEDAAYTVAETVPSSRVVELLLLAARIEEIGQNTAHISQPVDQVWQDLPSFSK